MPAPNESFSSIDEYIRAAPESVRETLEAVRRTVRLAAPEAEEVMSYRMPAFKLHGHALVYFAAFRHHIGLYPPAPDALKEEVARYEGPKGNLRFPLDEAIPLGLVRRITQARAREIRAERARKK
jgi:uncharacterized protein YdhG (YjbR/CyaY superfamily)